MNGTEFYLLYALVVTFFNADAIQGERIVTQPLSYHATPLLCDQAKERWHKMTLALYPDREPTYILRCDPPEYYYFEPAAAGFGALNKTVIEYGQHRKRIKAARGKRLKKPDTRRAR